jgi:hypothetical protein
MENSFPRYHLREQEKKKGRKNVTEKEERGKNNENWKIAMKT